MYRLIVVLVYLISVNCDELLGVDYSFDVDFYTYFSNKTCANENKWRLVSYDDLSIEYKSSVQSNGYGIQAIGNSCVSSFSMLFTNGILEFKVYVSEISKKVGITINIFDEHDVLVSSNDYRQFSEDLKAGWQTIQINITNTTKGYINLRGSTYHNEIVLIDSFRYIPYGLKISNKKELQRSVTVGNYIETVTEGSDKATEVIVVEEMKENERGNSFWNAFTIFFALVPTVFGVAAVAVSIYHCAKISTMKKETPQLPSTPSTPTTFAGDLESPYLVIIPRPRIISECY